MALDEIFGPQKFCNEVIWYYYNKMQGNVGRFASNHDTVLWYQKGQARTFNKQQESRGETVKQIKRVWDKETQKLVNAKDANGKVLYIETDVKTVDSVWRISMLQPADKSENAGYATQKPEALIGRIVSACSNEGDLIADFFCGSGTTAAVAEKLGRKWIATDLGKFAIHTTRKRLIGVQRQLKAEGKNYRAFEILNLGRYERSHYIGINPNLREEQQQQQLRQKEADFLALILKAYQAEPVSGFAFFQGKRAGRLVAIGPVNLPISRLFVEELILECRKQRLSRVDLLGFEFEMGLFPNVLDDARAKGIDIAPKYIPADVFDKRAVDKHQVVFHDVAYIEATPLINGNTVAIQLSDFTVFYSQDSIAFAEASLAASKKAGSRIIVDNGQIVKLSKNARGQISHDTLTQHWTDWIDYWAVDFNYESKREIIRVPLEPTAQDMIPGLESGQLPLAAYEERWTGDYIFENEWQSFRTRRDRSLELTTIPHELSPGRRKIAVKVVDIFGNDTMTILDLVL